MEILTNLPRIIIGVFAFIAGVLPVIIVVVYLSIEKLKELHNQRFYK